ncbi:SDR family NAD(P)-dependent oxidoreductase [Brevundimonas variabilis]|uniref:NAD(P)-dependent dehydrogenase (Short-subunit alcohol dehydrogenase family) n=1 Tax=Brevundimonas variabilis TaxID=74312 RepID=A0A7W9CF90_9CAUL|nr:SDR family NAD(P)-dependent oxidoreductase [Brevundimonas variabilis]MBB5744545.1 NAD(P)-dependent dehydrogenase (short-subunit alcohol dehydrogenase family) [Brevundimonas variabilis]
MTDSAAVVIGASGGIGSALADRLQTSGTYAVVHRLSRSGSGLDLEDETTIAAAASNVAEGPPVRLIFIATGVLHDGQEPERSYRAMTAEHLLRDYRINTVGPALVARHFAPLLPREGRSVLAALSARVGSIGDNRLGGWHSYRASKAALNMILRNLSIELARTHREAIVAGLHPGTVDTALSVPFQKGVTPGKLFTPEHSATRMLEVLDSLTPADSGNVFAFDGVQIPA